MRPSGPAARPGALLAALLLAVALAGCTADNKTTENETPGDPYHTTPPAEHAAIKGLTHLAAEAMAPDFETTTIDGETFRLSDHLGKVVFIEFMGVGCSSCLRNLPDHKRLYDEFKSDPDFVFVGIDVWGRETEDDLRAYREEHGIEWILALDHAGAEKTYNVPGTPTQYFIDHGGRAHSKGAVLSYASMKEELTYLLAEQDKASEEA